jgi:hypothetical protein
MYTYEQLLKANTFCETTKVKEKDYVEVNQRIKAFRSICPGGAILTEMLSNENGVCVFKATICDENMKVIGTGTAYEKETSSFINKTSYIENCETSAVGRALGMCGFGIDTSVCSAEELQNAILNQDSKQTNLNDVHPRDLLRARLDELKIDPHKYAADHNLKGEKNPDVFWKLLKELEHR